MSFDATDDSNPYLQCHFCSMRTYFDIDLTRDVPLPSEMNCDHCGRRNVLRKLTGDYRKYSLGQQHVAALKWLIQVGGEAPLDDMEDIGGFGRKVVNPFNLCRYFGLVEQVYDYEKTNKRGHPQAVAGRWRITPLGRAWVRGSVQIPKYVYKVCEYDIFFADVESPLVWMTDVDAVWTHPGRHTPLYGDA